MYQGIIFDFDGVLAMTMEDNFEAWKKTFEPYDYAIDRHEFMLMEGKKLNDIAALYIERSHALANPDGMVAEKDAYYLAHHSFAFYPGVESLIARLHSIGIPLGVATAATRARLDVSVPKKFLEQFNVIVSAETGGRGKPYPDPYAYAAHEMKLSPRECIVVENAPLGIESAKDAGAYCIAVASTLPKGDLSQADETVFSFEEVAETEGVRTFLR